MINTISRKRFDIFDFINLQITGFFIMICTTVREGEDCVLMTAKGCGYNEGHCLAIVDECNGCQRLSEYKTGSYCTAAPDPSLKWKNGNCNLATHIKAAAAAKKQKINPIKASKRR